MPQDELPPLGKAVVRSYEEGDLNYPVVVIAKDPRAVGYVVPATYDACTDPRFPNNKFIRVEPTNLDNRVLWVYERIPGKVAELEERWDDELQVWVSTFAQNVLSSAEPEAPGPSATSAYALYHNSISSLSIDDPGSGYTSIPTISIGSSAGGGTQATATVTSLKVVSATIVNPGTGLSIGSSLTISGGTGTAGTVAVASVGLSTLASDAAGSGYSPENIIILSGGVSNSPAVVLVNTTKLVSLTINARGTGMVAGSTTLTMVGGTSSVSATATVTTTRVVSATVAAGGSGGTDGTQTVTGTTGTGTKFQASVTVSGGAITAVLSITVPGSYTANPTTIATEPVTGASLSGAQLNVVMGVDTVTIANAGSFTVNATSFTSTGGGNNATFSSPIFGVNTFTITIPGQYTLAPTTFVQESVSPSGGLGATFQTATFYPLSLSVSSGGAYTVIASSPASVSGGSGLTALLDFGIGATSLTNAGTLYYNSYTPVTLSAGNGSISAVMDTATRVLATGYIVDSKMLEIPDSPNRRYIYTLMPIPPTQFSEPEISYEFPALFYILTAQADIGPCPGFDYILYPHRRGRFKALQIDTYKIGMFTDIPDVFTMLCPGAGSKVYPIPGNCAHPGGTFYLVDSSNTITYRETFGPSTPYSIGQWLVVAASQKRIIGSIWRKTVTYLREDT